MKRNLFKIYIAFNLVIIILCNFTGCTFFKSKRYFNEIVTVSKEFSLDKAFLFALIHTESGFEPDVVSNKGAIGLMQLMPQTANYIADISNYKNKVDLFDVKCNLNLGCAYLNYLGKKFKSEKEILCAYNAGEGTVRNWLLDLRYSVDGETLNIIPYRETERYVQKIERLKKYYQSYLDKRGYRE